MPIFSGSPFMRGLGTVTLLTAILGLMGCPSASTPTTPPTPTLPSSSGVSSPASTSPSSSSQSNQSSSSGADSRSSTGEPSSATTRGSASNMPPKDMPGSAPKNSPQRPDTSPNGDVNSESRIPTQTGSNSESSQPGFGDLSDEPQLPSMVDTFPTFNENYGSIGNSQKTSEVASENSAGKSIAGNANANNEKVVGTEKHQAPGESGTRADEGLGQETFAEGPLTTAEQVAILDRELEASTRDFDGIIYDDETRQREAARERAARAAQANDRTASKSNEIKPSSTDEGVNTVRNIVGRGVGDRASSPPGDGPKYPAPADIPNGNNDDVVARQLREAAMREPDPIVREKLWNEYRKYKGIKVPQS